MIAASLSISIFAAEPPPERIQAFARVFLTNTIARPLRYTPDGTDFVITNGGEFFNRPLYGGNTAFRVDAGDVPEFSLYLPGRGGNLRLGFKTPRGVKWLNDADQIVARYRAGSMVYEIHDSLLTAQGELHLTAIPGGTKSFIIRAELNSTASPVELLWAFGGANGMKGARGGDIGCEREPVGKFFQLRPEQCRGNEIALQPDGFTLMAKSATILGTASLGAKFTIVEATNWFHADALASAPTAELPIVTGKIKLSSSSPVFLGLQVAGNDAKDFHAEDLPKLFNNAEAQRHALASRVAVETPDASVNAAAAALNVAADAIWDDAQQSFMHGAVAWRSPLLGWRGPYVGDALGWHERTAKHFLSYARRQNTEAVPEKIPAPEESANLSRNETALHSNGDLMNRSHYDMNLLAVDAFFRHLLWTGDLEFARTNWPVIARHLAWERRLFRREFGPEKLPLYEAYAAIWASDDLAYNGGGATHASALNFYANKMAARVAKQIGQDAAPYEREADLILQAMRKFLWLPDAGNFAEFKDLLGMQLVHPNAALWTFYHTLDSEVPTPREAAQMAEWTEENLAHIPVSTFNFPFVLPTTSWLPYQWSLNNVVVAEDAHAALGFWQANRADTAFALFKGTVLDTMFGGLCPGNVGCMTRHDAVRGEAQRDFGDGIGALSRALVEGLFGVQPDLLAGEIKIRPGFPADWNSAKISHPDFNFSFHRDGLRENYSLATKFPKPVKLVLQIPALRDSVASATVNGSAAKWKWLEDSGSGQRIEIETVALVKQDVMVEWKGKLLERRPPARRVPVASGKNAMPEVGAPLDWSQPVVGKLEALDLSAQFNHQVTQIFRHEYRSPRSPFASLAMPKQGIGSWCHPLDSFTVDDSGLRELAAKADGKIILPNGVPLATPGALAAKNIAFVSQWENYPREISVPLAGKSSHAFLLMAGSTGAMQSRLDNGEVIATYTDGSTARLALHNPTTWWPIDQDYFIDDFAFARPEPLPVRVDLATGKIRVLKMESFKGRGRTVPGGAATVLDLPLDAGKELKSLTVRALANEVVIGLMSVTLQR